MTELLNMDRAELERDAHALRHDLFKARLGLELKKEKNSGSYKQNKRQLSRILTAIKMKPVPLQKTAASPTVPAHKSAKKRKSGSAS